MDSLPVELYLKIFSFCDFGDLLRIRLVSKRYNYVISQFRPKELVFISESTNKKYLRLYFQPRDVWYHVSRPLDKKYIIHQSKQFILTSTIIDVQQLRRIRISLELNNDKKKQKFIKFSSLSRFKILESLEIEIKGKSSAEQQSTKEKLALPNLKILSYDSDGAIQVQFDCPLLLSLDLLNSPIESVEFLHTLSIRFLKIDYDWIYTNKESFHYLSTFKNVECFCFDNESFEYKELIGIFPNLNTIRIEGSACQIDDNFINKIHKSFKDQKHLSHLNFYFRGIKIDPFHSSNRSYYHYYDYSNNDYDNDKLFIDHLYWYRNIHISKNDSLLIYYSTNFHKRLSNLQTLSVSGLRVNEEFVLKFISNCESLCKLDLRGTEFSQSFFDLLGYRSNLNFLRINENTKIVLNYEFLNLLSYLEILETNRLPDNFDRLNVNRLIYLDKLEFEFRNRKIVRIFKIDFDCYVVRKCQKYGISERDRFNMIDLAKRMNQLNDQIFSQLRSSAFKRQKTK